MRNAAARSFSWSVLAMMSAMAAGYSSVLGDLSCRLFQGIPNRIGSGGHTVDAFKFQRQGSQIISKLRH